MAHPLVHGNVSAVEVRVLFRVVRPERIEELVRRGRLVIHRHLLAAADRSAIFTIAQIRLLFCFPPRFQVPLLTDLAVNSLVLNITVDNFVDRLLMADACHTPQLKVFCSCLRPVCS